MWAVCLVSITFPAQPARHVLMLADGLNMRRVDTASVAAEMVKLLSLWHWSYKGLIDHTVSALHTPIPPRHAIATAVRARPLPTPIGYAHPAQW